MVKFYFTFILLFIIGANGVFAQAPKITYASPQTYTRGTAISPLIPANSGGAIPSGPYTLYTQTSLIAGNGLYGNNNGDSNIASFAYPLGITSDPFGNIYIADANNNQIRKIDNNGIVSVFAGSGAVGSANGTGMAASFSYPTGVVADAAGDVYVADYANNMIRKITPAGVVTTLAGSGTSGAHNGTGTAASFFGPNGITLDVHGNIIIADTYNHLIRKITPAGVVTTLAGSTPGSHDGTGTAASFYAPFGVLGDPSGNVYVADTYNNLIRKISSTGVVSTVQLTAGYVYMPVGLALDSLHNLYVTGQLNNIAQISPTGRNNTFFAGNFNGGSYYGTDTTSTFGGSMGINFDGVGNLLIADPNNHLIRKVSLTGYQVLGSYKTLTGPIDSIQATNKEQSLTTFQIGNPLPKGLKLDTAGTGTISGTPTIASSATNYYISAFNAVGSSTDTLNITVKGLPQTITFNALPAKTYGDNVFTPTATSTNATIPITYASSDTTVASVVNNTTIRIRGAGTAIITANQGGDTTYSAATPVNQTLTVAQAVLNVKANNQSKVTGADNPTLTIAYSGFVNSDDSTALTTLPLAQTTATPTSPAGTYPIMVSGGTARNYSLNYVAGTLTVFPIPVITPNGPTLFFNGGSVVLSASPATGYNYQWYKDSVAISGATLPTYTASLSGSYTVSIGAGSAMVTSTAVVVNTQFHLAANNFKIALTSATCKGSNNGVINITAAQPLKYTAALSFNNIITSKNFTDTTSFTGLSPGAYSICFTVDSQTYLQCFNVNVTEPKDLSVYSVVNKATNSVSLNLDGGSLYYISLNNAVYTTSQSSITLPLAVGNNQLQVTTDKLCQGTVDKLIIASDKIIPYPDPFENVLNVNLGNATVGNVQINIYSVLDGRQVYNSHYTNQSGVIQLDLSSLSGGMYFFKISLDGTESTYKILKK
jgi:hypothetical protein